MAPHIDDDRVRYIGPVGGETRFAVIGQSHALLHLIDFDEPFGYSVVEALACGTPVIAYNRGSMAELIEDGRDGYLVDNIEGACRAVDAVAHLNREAIRASTVRRFDRTTMVARYADLYYEVVIRGR